MKTFQFKIKSYDNEEGEYSEWQQAESGTIIQFILNHWFNETLPNNLDVVVIKNSKGDQLALDHERKDVFRYFFVPKESGWSYYYKMTDITFMFFTLESFFNNLTEDLVSNMNKTMDDWRWVKGDFLQKNFHFKMRMWGLINHFTGPAIIVLIWFTLLILVILADSTTVRLVIGGIWILWSLFGFRLRNKIIWYLDQKNLEIVLSRGDRFIQVVVNGLKKSIPKSDIASINQYFEYNEDMWIPFFTEITFQNGNVLNLTDLIISQYVVRDKFYFEQHLFQEHNVNKIALRKRTDLSLYFPGTLSRIYLK